MNIALILHGSTEISSSAIVSCFAFVPASIRMPLLPEPIYVLLPLLEEQRVQIGTLKALGYNATEIKGALKDLPVTEDTPTAEAVKMALRRLQKN